jgi:hypothetical protein
MCPESPWEFLLHILLLPLSVAVHMLLPFSNYESQAVCLCTPHEFDPKHARGVPQTRLRLTVGIEALTSVTGANTLLHFKGWLQLAHHSTQARWCSGAGACAPVL